MIRPKQPIRLRSNEQAWMRSGWRRCDGTPLTSSVRTVEPRRWRAGKPGISSPAMTLSRASNWPCIMNGMPSIWSKPIGGPRKGC